jgi:hypothetical protein
MHFLATRCIFVGVLAAACAFVDVGLSTAKTNTPVSTVTQPVSDSTTELHAAVQRMNRWLGTGAKAEGWRRYLLLNVLDSQAAKGWHADIETLKELEARFSRDTDGLDHPAFLDVRNAIRNQINQLSRLRFPGWTDLQSATRDSLGKYRRTSISKLEYDRDVAKYELQLLKKFYRSTMPSRKRALIFVELELDEAIAFLDEVQFELPPEVSAGKIESLIRDQRQSIDEVQDKIDALPVEESERPSPDDDDDEPSALDALDAPVLPDSVPPQPDTDSDTLEELEQRMSSLKDRVEELLERRSQILKVDTPRLKRRLASARRLREIHRNFVQVGKKQFDPYFVSAANAFDKFYFYFRYGTDDNLQEDFLRKLMELEKLVPSLQDPSDRQSHVRIGELLEWLEVRNQVPELTAAIRAQHSHPNLYLSISSNLISAVGPQQESARRAVAEDIFGRFVRGEAFTHTNVNVDLLPDPNQVHASIHLTGSVSSRTYVRQRSLRINATSSGQLEGRRSVYANFNGLLAGDPSVAADLASQLQDLQGFGSQFDFVNKIARKQFDSESGRSSAEASRRAEKELSERFNSETDDAIDQGRDGLKNAKQSQKEFLNEFAEKTDGFGADAEPTRRERATSREKTTSFFLPRLFMHSDYDRIEVVANKDLSYRLAAINPPTEHQSGSDVQLRLHESMISNYLDLIFSGKTFTRSELAEKVKELTGDVPDMFKEQVDEDGEVIPEFVITLAQSRPIQVTFDDNKLGVTINATRFEQGERGIDVPLVIDLKMKVVNENGKLKVKTDGLPSIKISEEDDPSFESVAFLAILEKRIAKGAEEAEKKGAQAGELPPNLLPKFEDNGNAQILASLQLGLFKLDDGWLYVGWNLGGGMVETPAIWTEQIINQYDGIYTPIEAPLETDGSESTTILVEPPTDVVEPVSILSGSVISGSENPVD